MSLFYSGGCMLCQQKPQYQFKLCKDCLDAMPFLGARILEEQTFCVYALLRENALSNQMIRGLKYRGETHYKKVFALMAADFLMSTQLHDVDYICAVATSKKKRRIRGYNPPALIAEELATLLDKTYQDVIVLKRPIQDQIGLGAKARFKNVAGAFGSTPISGKVLLIDDTYTTGATLNACKDALISAGAREVIGLVCMKAASVDVE